MCKYYNTIGVLDYVLFSTAKVVVVKSNYKKL
jgi:hypothetical protein